jgi:hypothetical protein
LVKNVKKGKMTKGNFKKMKSLPISFNRLLVCGHDDLKIVISL